MGGGVPSFGDRETAMESIARVWGREDLGVADLVAKLPASFAYSSREGAWVTLLQDLIARDPSMAFKWIDQHVDQKIWTSAVGSELTFS